jgi:galactokinase
MPTMDSSETRQFFRETFGSEPDVISSAPGRVNLIGEHTDYNGGQVLPIAIDRRTYVAMRALPDGRKSRIVSRPVLTSDQFDSRKVQASGLWWDYMTGACAAMSAEGTALPQFEALVHGDVPIGSGLSSSAALEVATALALAKIVGQSVDLQTIALRAWEVETGFVGVACGIMDQFASALCTEGHALHLHCDTRANTQVPMSETVLIFDTRSPRYLRQSQFNQRRAECQEALALLRRQRPSLPNLAAAEPDDIRDSELPPILKKRALHVAEETRRVETLVTHLNRTGIIRGELLYESHASLRDNYECSSPELDWFVENASEIEGVMGARLTGAGWGGCAIAVGSRDSLAGAAETLTSSYRDKFKRIPVTWLTHAAAGARIDESGASTSGQS